MKKVYFYSASLLFGSCLLFTGCEKELKIEGVQSVAELKTLFNDPPADYRSTPLWDWNDRITEEGISFQMEEFKKAGMGGVFVHPRPGLITEYLSAEWFHLFDFTVKKGRELGIKVWIYDENSYPSGFAGGHVPAEMPDSYKHGTGLAAEKQDTLRVRLSDTIAVVLKLTGAVYTDVTETAEDEIGNAGPFYVFRKTYPDRSPWYGGFPYVDLLYPEVTDKFIEITMTRGYERNIDDFGKTLPGIFTDEPNLEASMSEGSMLRWTPDLFDEFEDRWGYSLQENLPTLIEETGSWKKVRHDYYELILELFVDRWAKPWSMYCDDRDLKWTGHYWEHGWPVPTDGSDEASFYIWHQMPGIDMLGNRLDSLGLGGQFGNDRAVRELLSAANQAGRQRTLSETYGGGGWEMSFEKQKRLVDWECALGVNFVNQHLSYYSINGVRKFDYPPSFSYHEPWWDRYRVMGDYIGRICMAVSSGQQINRTLVLQPNTTAWMYFSRKEQNPMMNNIRDGFKNFIYQLEQLQIEYDLGSENVLREIGSVKGNDLRVGRRNYSLVVIPAQMENLDNNTLDLLTEFLAKGGKVLSFNPAINFVDGVESPKINELAGKYRKQWTTLDKPGDPSALAHLENKEFSIDDISRNGMLYHQRRILKDGQVLFLVNSHPTENASCVVTVDGKYVSMLDPKNGRVMTYPSKTSKGKVSFAVELDPEGSALFAVTQQEFSEPAYIIPGSGFKTVESITAKTVTTMADNVLVLNYLDLKTERSEKKDIYFMEALTGLFRENGVDLGNPWQHKIQYKKDYLKLDTLFGEKSGFRADYHFTVRADLPEDKMKTLRVVVERPELWQVSINGNPVNIIPGEYWIDKSFPLYLAGQYLKHGKNTITLTSPRMTILTELMPVYVLGDFLVKPAVKGFEISGGELKDYGSWKKLGLPFYSQKVSYTKIFEIKKDGNSIYRIQLSKWNGSLCDVKVNGQSAGIIAWKPYEADVTGFLNEGKNEIEVTVYGSLKNTFGFFYNKPEGWIFGPWSWNGAPEHLPSPDEYYIPDYGMMKPFRLIVAKTAGDV
jgi:hypothetical protein